MNGNKTLIIFGPIGHAEFFEGGNNTLFVHETHVTFDLFARFIIKYLSWNRTDTETLCLFPVLPDIDEDNGGTVRILILKFSDNGGHHLAGDAFVRTKIHYGGNTRGRYCWYDSVR